MLPQPSPRASRVWSETPRRQSCRLRKKKRQCSSISRISRRIFLRIVARVLFPCASAVCGILFTSIDLTALYIHNAVRSRHMPRYVPTQPRRPSPHDAHASRHELCVLTCVSLPPSVSCSRSPARSPRALARARAPSVSISISASLAFWLCLSLSRSVARSFALSRSRTLSFSLVLSPTSLLSLSLAHMHALSLAAVFPHVLQGHACRAYEGA